MFEKSLNNAAVQLAIYIACGSRLLYGLRPLVKTCDNLGQGSSLRCLSAMVIARQCTFGEKRFRFLRMEASFKGRGSSKNQGYSGRLLRQVLHHISAYF